jgi:hypothetical protein
MIDGFKRKAEKQTNPCVEPDKRFSIGSLNFIVCAFDLCRVGNSPMSSRWMPRPYRANFIRCVVAHSENEVHCRCIKGRKFVPRLTSQARCRYACGLEFPQRLWSYPSRWMTSRAVRSESPSGPSIRNRFGHDRTGRVASAKKEDVVVTRHWQHVGLQHGFGFTARTNALKNLPSTCGAIASTSMFCPVRNSRASSTR